LETAKWKDVLERDGHECYYMAGELDTPHEKSFLVPACHFSHPGVQEVYKECFGHIHRSADTTRKIEELKHGLKQSIRDFVDRFDLDLIIPENAVTIPLNIPLGLAITEFAVETAFPMIVHNHDFFWERKRFLYNACWDYLNKAFPPHLLTIQHAVLNSSQDNQLSLRKGISAVVVPNVMDFANPPPPKDDYTKDLRKTLGIKPEEKFILQPTRIVQRKGIEHAIELVHRLKIPAKLVISHASGDEGDEYTVRVMERRT
ncbi:glycosyl transferase family 1, partial [bacterium B17]